MANQQYYSVPASFDIPVDATDPTSVAAAAAFVEKLKAGSITDAPTGLKIVCGKAKIVRKKNGG